MTSGTPARVSVSADLQLVEFAPRILCDDGKTFKADPQYRYIQPAEGYAGKPFCLSAWMEPEQAARIVHCVNKYDALAHRVEQLEAALRVCRATLPHMGGNPMSTHSLCADIDAALSGVSP
jgi:hypothetical protein